MKISLPAEPVYYYERSKGKTRLFYFIPPNELEHLVASGEVSEQAVTDYPDGVDLGCTEWDFAEFEDIYGYRPPFDPEALSRTFFAVLSTNRKWKKIRGTGFIPAREFESYVPQVEESLRAENILPEIKEARVDAAAPLEERRKQMVTRSDQQRGITKFLEKLQVSEIDPSQSIDQSFRPIQMGEGIPSGEVFVRVHQKGKEKR
ncbi:MAG: hypothetical protein AAF591_09290 [Verrucomicrobiota bacterium]